MIVSIKLDSLGKSRQAQFEAIKCGLTYAALDDNVLNVVVSDIDKADRFSKRVNGTILGFMERLERDAGS